MEKLGFKFTRTKPFTYLDKNNNKVESRCYELTKEDYCKGINPDGKNNESYKNCCSF
jgi:hypothetical protein